MKKGNDEKSSQGEVSGNGLELLHNFLSHSLVVGDLHWRVKCADVLKRLTVPRASRAWGIDVWVHPTPTELNLSSLPRWLQ